jgi:hypothetical protein
MNLNGQWVGGLSGTNSGEGSVILNVERGPSNRNYASIHQYSFDIPAYRLDIDISFDGNKVVGTATNPQFFDPQIQGLVPADLFKQKNQKVAQLTFSKRIIFNSLELGENKIAGAWSGENSPGGTFTLFRTANQKPEPADFRFETWKEFRSHILERQDLLGKMIFRGQWNGEKKLRSSFHRAGRYNFEKYLSFDFNHLAQRVNSISKYIYDLKDPQDTAALLSLGQHHGFPTPMLDWTRSPFVAGFFAFSPHESELKKDGYARIFQFNSTDWEQHTYQSFHMLDPMPTISPRIMPAHNNPRAMPQQSVMMLTNLDDIEGFVRSFERLKGIKYLTIFEVSHKAHNEVLNELRLMGITSASLFPDFEGICRELKLLFFPSE